MIECDHYAAMAAIVCGVTQAECTCGATLRALAPTPLPPSSAPRTEPRVLDAERALDNLARWLPVIEGRAAGLEPVVAAGRHDGRPDYVDERNRSLQEALGALAWLAQIPRGPRLVLLYVYLWTGKDSRAAYDAGKDLWKGFDVRTALVFATPEKRVAWLLNQARSMATDAMREAGKALRLDALEAFGTPVRLIETAPDHGWLALARDEITRMVRAADLAQREITHVRERQRLGLDSSASRKERRASMHPRKTATPAKTEGLLVDTGHSGRHSPE